jgi:hypothetical protein
MSEFFRLWGILSGFQLSPERGESFVWRWTVDGNFSTKSAYSAFFAGTTVAPVSTEIWWSRAPYGCKFFAWLITRNRCWTADRLHRRGLPSVQSGAGVDPTYSAWMCGGPSGLGLGLGKVGEDGVAGCR